MKPVKKILVPVDFSAPAAQALTFAADLARRYDADLDLVYVYEPISYMLPEGYPLLSAEQIVDIIGQFEKQLVAAKQAALSAGAPRVATELLQGTAVHEIVHFAKQHGSDLIVMGTHGRTGLKHLMLGSVAENVVRSAPCPVLTVRAGT